MENQEVIIVGAGISGLCCARTLHRQGVPVRILESSDAIGGRVRTDNVDGFHCDRGFQVLPLNYPEARRVLDYERLNFGRFSPGALIRHAGKFHRFSDPMRDPRHLLTTLLSPIGTLADKIRLARLRREVCRGTLEELYQHPEMTTLEKLNRLGFSQRLIERFFRPFFGGVFLNQDLSTSSRMFDFVFRMFSNDSVALPANGMQSIALQIADQLPAGTISTNAPVARIEGKRVWMKSGESLEASQVVVACEAPAAARLLGEEPGKAEAHGVSCIYFASDKPPFDEPILVLNGEGRGPINSVCVPSQVATGYAPEGQSLISVTVLGLPDDQEQLHRAVVGQLEEWYGVQVKQWRHLKTDRIRYGLPKQPPPSLSPVEKPSARDNGIFVCGDYLDTASIQGAMMSGRRAAESILESRADLASGHLSNLTLEQATA